MRALSLLRRQTRVKTSSDKTGERSTSCGKKIHWIAGTVVRSAAAVLFCCDTRRVHSSGSRSQRCNRLHRSMMQRARTPNFRFGRAAFWRSLLPSWRAVSSVIVHSGFILYVDGFLVRAFGEAGIAWLTGHDTTPSTYSRSPTLRPNMRHTAVQGTPFFSHTCGRM